MLGVGWALGPFGSFRVPFYNFKGLTGGRTRKLNKWYENVPHTAQEESESDPNGIRKFPRERNNATNPYVNRDRVEPESCPVQPESSNIYTKSHAKPIQRYQKVIRAESERAPVSTNMIQFLRRIAIGSNPNVVWKLRKVQVSMFLVISTRLVLLCTHASSPQRDALTSESRHQLSSTAWVKFRSVAISVQIWLNCYCSNDIPSRTCAGVARSGPAVRD